MRIGWDVDGVIADFVGDVLTQLGRDEYYIDIDQIIEHDIMKYIPESVREKYDARLATCFEHLPIYSETLKIIESIPAQHYYITVRPQAVMQTYRWFAKHNIPSQGIFFAHDEHEKAEIASFLHLDAYIDDKYENVVAVAKHVKKTFLLTRPWNRSYEIPEGVLRLSSIEDLHSHL
jgi:uncharacterized HAD superfamily protein